MMFKNKKGISPLIATVLIIGFTVALAALIITWGGQFVRQTQGSVGEENELGLACSKLNFDITAVVCVDPPIGEIRLSTVRVNSNSEQGIAGFIMRSTGDGGLLVDDKSEIATALTGFDGETLSWNSATGGPGPSNNPTSVEVIGLVQIPGGAAVPCEAGIQSVVISKGSAPTCVPG
ncbi:MAG: archaellin/type IV pilin N-terminal domain-containing protein [Candidatus Woesearchaeota archaeon]